MVESLKPRTRRRKEARPAEIMAAGMQEFAMHGFERARLDRIAKAAGISKGTIYLYYPSKEALFLAAVEENVIRVMAEGEMRLQGATGTTEELLVQLLESIYERMVEGHAKTLLRILIAEADRMPHLVETYHDMAIQRGMQLLKKILLRGVARGEVAESAIIDNPQVLMAPAIFLALHGNLFGKISPIDPKGHFAAHVEMILHGVLRR